MWENTDISQPDHLLEDGTGFIKGVRITTHSYAIQYKRTMAVFCNLGLVSLTVLMLASQLDFTSAAVRVFGLYASGLTGDPAGNEPDPYVKVWCGSNFGGMTEFRRDNANPSWSAVFNFPNCSKKDDLKFQVWDKDLIYDDHLGTCQRRVQRGSFSGNCHLNDGILFYKSFYKSEAK